MELGHPGSPPDELKELRVPIRVLLVDDHVTVLERVKKLLSSEFTVVATASDGQEMLSACAIYNPDVVVTDVTMHGMSGIDASRKLLEIRPGTPIVIFSVHREAQVVQSAFDAGVIAYVHKLSGGDD